MCPKRRKAPGQADLPFARRFEIPFTRITWRDGERTMTVHLGAHCIDEDWPWWTPDAAWRIARQRGLVELRNDDPHR